MHTSGRGRQKSPIKEPYYTRKRPTDIGAPQGDVAKAKGRVCWMFAGKQCYGTLLPARETASMCYARTHKGNVKTLTKGGAYWWMIE